MPVPIPLLADPVLYAIEAKLRDADPNKFDLFLTWKVLAPTGYQFITGALEDQAINTWDGSWWPTTLGSLMTSTVEDWGYELPT